MRERFKVCRYNNNYLISNYGRVYSHKSSKFLKPRCNGRGYLSVSVLVNTKRKNLYIHRLVAETFVPRTRGCEQVNHIDENKDNNVVSNLEWVTAKQNVNHSYDNIYNKIANITSKTYLIIYPTGLTKVINNLRQFCRENSLHQGSMSHVARGNRTHHKGYRCKLLDIP